MDWYDKVKLATQPGVAKPVPDKAVSNAMTTDEQFIKAASKHDKTMLSKANAMLDDG